MADTFFSSDKRYPLTLKPITPPANKETHQDIFNILNSIKSILRDLELILATFVPEAPKDGKQYARQDGAWSIVIGVWGSITGLLSDQTDLNTALSGKEPTLAAGTTAQYYRGDKSWQTLNWAAVSEKPTFAAVATSGSYLDLSNTPTIPAAQVNSDWNATSGVAQVLNKPSVRVHLTAARTYYVRTDGNDSNTGLTDTAGGAFLTIQRAIDVVSALDNGGFDVTISLGIGTFTGMNVLKSFVGAGKTVISGAGAGSTVVQVSTASTACFSLPNGAPPLVGLYDIVNMTLQATAASCIGIDLGYGQGGVVTFGNVEFGSFPSGLHLRAGRGALLSNVSRAYSISGNSTYHIYCYDGGQVRGQETTVTLSGTVTFDIFVVVQRQGNVLCNANTYSGTASGKKYQLETLSYALGVSTFPGSTAGTADATSVAEG